MKYLFSGILALTLLAGCATTSTPASRVINLFNGSDLSGWHADIPDRDKDPNLPPSFVVRNKELISLGKPGGHLVTDKIYRDYILEVEYRFVNTPGNCGVLVHASTPRVLYGMFPKSIEVQLMHENAGDFWCIGEDIKVPDMEQRRGPKENWGVTEGKGRRILNLTDGSEKPLGEWNHLKVECRGNRIQVWVNSIPVNDGYDCTVSEGRIALQAEGAVVAFRKVQLTY